jgi:hypothetical protein
MSGGNLRDFGAAITVTSITNVAAELGRTSQYVAILQR